MGMHIDLMGRISVTPALNDAETEYLRALACAGPARDGTDAYAVPVHPRLEVLLRKRRREVGVDLDRELDPDVLYSRTGGTEPPMGCGWSPCAHGCCLSWSGVEKFYYPADWLRYMVENLLGPAAATSRSPDLTGFTFDHRLDGVVAVSCAETE